MSTYDATELIAFTAIGVIISLISLLIIIGLIMFSESRYDVGEDKMRYDRDKKKEDNKWKKQRQ